MGALSDMPAVKWFALYAAVALSLNFIMQITCFIAAMSIDEQRRDNSLGSVICGKASNSADDKNRKKEIGQGIQFRLFIRPP